MIIPPTDPKANRSRLPDRGNHARILALALLSSLAGCHAPREFPSTATSDFSRHYSEGDRQSLEMARKPETLESARQRTSRRISMIRERVGSTGDEGEIDDLEDELEILNYLDRNIASASRRDTTEAERLSVNLQSERILNLLENEEAGSSKRHRIPEAMMGLVPTFTLGHRIPGPPGRHRDEVLGKRNAELESSFLYNEENKAFYTPAELAGMTAGEVARLDVSPRHPAWYSSGTRPDDCLRRFESWMRSGVTAALREDGDLPRGADWNLHSTRRVLFLNEVYKSATSAKAKTEDAYGVEWKIKWGDECQSEAVSSRLYLLAGAKMTDLVFAGGGGPDEAILILAEKGDYSRDGEDAGSERKPETLEQLAETLDEFYGFDIYPYIHSHGVINEANAGRLLKNLPDDGKSDHRRSSLMGRRWVSFKEYSVELRPKGFIRTVGGASSSDYAATEDRASRGLYLFSLWLSARDSKNDNNKSYFIKSPVAGSGSTMRIEQHFDGYHDLGVTLGSMGSAAHINAMTVGDDFLRDTGRAIKGRQTFIYRPKAYTNATWADAKWMADRITGLSDDQLKQAISASTWPDFMKETLFYKIASRRDQISRLFGDPGNDSPPPLAAPNISIDISSPEKVRGVERRYRLAPGSLGEELAKRKAESTGREILVKDGEVVDSDDSALITLLSIQRFPSGLSDRYKRMANRNPEALER